MPATNTLLANGLELALVFAGLVLLWRHVLSPAARAQPRPVRLVPWEAPLSDFLLFLWIAICGGLVFPMLAQLTSRLIGFSEETKMMAINTGFQGGMLIGIAVFQTYFSRGAARPAFGFTASLLPGCVTFLISLPLIVLVGLAWIGLLKLCGLPADPQDAVSFFKKSHSPGLVALMIALAALVAPLTEELIFRAGLFRYARTRLPRWAGLLLPACLFAALHNHLPSFAPLVALGVVFSLAYERTGLIGTSIVAHSLFNFYSVLRIFLDPHAT
jgi:membrane protease YdiL (CAAX protease family)